ncbi:MAG: tetratricopeptide repeat protein [Myxococcota bacterium]
MVSAYREAEKDDRYDLSESESLLNDIGYGFLSREQTDDAVTVFSLNTELFPNSANTHDSLGEALLARGDRSAALAEYKKAIALDPNSANARAMVEKLQAP